MTSIGNLIGNQCIIEILANSKPREVALSKFIPLHYIRHKITLNLNLYMSCQWKQYWLNI